LRTELSFSSDYKKVPITVFDGKQVNNSTTILEMLHGSYNKKQREEMRFLDKVVTESAEAIMYGNEENMELSFPDSSSFMHKVLPYIFRWKGGEDFNASNFEPCVLRMFQDDTRSSTEPGVIDLALFGILCDMEGCPELKQLFKKNPKVSDWYSTIDKKVGISYCADIYKKPEKKEEKYEPFPYGPV